MGKTRRSKDRPNNDNPLGLPSINSMLMQEELNGIEETTVGPVTAIVEQLQSVSVEEKMCALQTLATLCQNHQKINGIIESDIVRIASPLLMDPNINIRNATAGALRNLSVCGLEVCENLVEKDILTPLLALLNEYSTVVDWVPTFDNNSKDELDVRSDTFLQAVNIVWNLCESTSVAVESFNEAHLLQSFIRGLNYTVFGYDIGELLSLFLLDIFLIEIFFQQSLLPSVLLLYRKTIPLHGKFCAIMVRSSVVFLYWKKIIHKFYLEVYQLELCQMSQH